MTTHLFFSFSLLLFQNETEEKQDNNLSFNEYTIEPVRLQKEDKPNTKTATSPIAPTSSTSPKSITTPTSPTSPTSSTSRDKLPQMSKDGPMVHKSGGINGGEETQLSKIEPDVEEESRPSTTKPEKTNDDKQKSLVSIFKYYTETNQFNGYVEVETPTSDVCWVCTEILKREDVIIRSGCGCNARVHGRCLTQLYDACNNERNQLAYHGKIGNESVFLRQCGLCREYLIGSEQAEVRYTNTISALHKFDDLKEIERQVCWMEWLPQIIKSFLERIMSINIHWRSQGRKLKCNFLFISYSYCFLFVSFPFVSYIYQSLLFYLFSFFLIVSILILIVLSFFFLFFSSSRPRIRQY